MKKIIYIIILLLVLGIFYYYHGINLPLDKNSKENIKFVVESGEGVNQISYNLHEKKIIKSKLLFETYLWKEKKEDKIKAGEYNLSSSMNIKEIVEVLEAGKIIKNERNIKIIEGWNIKDIDSYLAKENILLEKEFMNKLKDISISDFNFLEKEALEGFLFPDTYRIYNNATAEDIIYKMLSNFDKKLDNNLREEIRKQGKSIYEIITMASIIEKEVRSIEDMKIVSGIFWNRIKNGQALESCATLAYIIGINKKQYTYEDTRINSPYNTYMNQGLPPGPICNPGLKAIQAAIYPEFTDYNYFLSSSKDGKTIFSRNLEEHNKNKIRYLK